MLSKRYYLLVFLRLVAIIGTIVDPVLASSREPFNCGQGSKPLLLETISLRADKVSPEDQASLFAAIGCVNGLISEIGIPTEFTLSITQHNSSLAYFPVFDELIATVQLMNPMDRSLKSKELTLSTLVHEYGHVIFFHNLPWWNEYRAYADGELLIVQERETLRLKIKELEQKAHGEFSSDSQNELATTQLQFENTYEKLVKSLEKGKVFKDILMPITGPYTELFSDLLAVINFRDGTIMSKAINSNRAGEKEAIDFTLKHDAVTWTDNEVHCILSPTRSYLWNSIKKIKSESEMVIFLRTVYDVMVSEISMRYEKSEISLSPKEINIRLLEALARSSI